MLDIVYGYQNLLENIGCYIDDSKFKKEYLIEQLGISRATFYNKVKKKSFTIDEMVILSNILFPEEAKAFEIKEALRTSREDSKNGRTKAHMEVMHDVRKKLRA
ncbi:hypothetical protein FGM00_14930 [Aggregatimonas sangjinii]|uniref:Uncharacterized protein n=1 Tax=Aggregatimonas sangjinii TaxID=2583587 RepID=A0A5B7SX78_9FLAO|nr:hypothetical protein [Aggregatimonas sangjinii]QCX01340.1 hypothetical protein FGM00_14930 [Aggregatimonas sangjinii]